MGQVGNTPGTEISDDVHGRNVGFLPLLSPARQGMEDTSVDQLNSVPGTDVSAPPLNQIFAYRWRMHITLGILLIAWVGAGVSPPIVDAGTLPTILADYIGWLMFFSGLTLRFWATRFIGGRKSCEVICSGPYSLTRNPLYVGTFLMIFSLAFFLKSPTFVAATAVVIAYYCVAVVPLEESLLRRIFGVEYRNYCESVSRWLPRFGAVYSPPLALISHPMKNEVRRAVWWFLLPLLAELHTYCRALPEWPRWLNWP